MNNSACVSPCRFDVRRTLSSGIVGRGAPPGRKVHRCWQLERPRGIVHEVLANGSIPFPRVRVVDDSGLVGDYHISEARVLAAGRNTDLVLISAVVEPPLCKLIPLARFLEDLDKRASAEEQRRIERRLKEFSFDPTMKVKGMRFVAQVDEDALERKVKQTRNFIEAGHRVEVRVLQGRCPPEDVLDMALRIIAETRDIAKPQDFDTSLGMYQRILGGRKAKASKKAPPSEMILRLWPCTPEQASKFVLPASVLGPRRRRGPYIVGVDEDLEKEEDAWKFNRKRKDKPSSSSYRVAYERGEF